MATIALILLVLVIDVQSQWIQNNVTNTMPYAEGNRQMAVAQFEGRIYLLGGDPCDTCLIEFDIATKQWLNGVEDDPLPRKVVSPWSGQLGYYSQIERQLYMIDYQSPFINVFKLETKTLVYNWTIIPRINADVAAQADEFGCMATTSTHLHLIGGFGTDPILILEIATKQWSVGPSLQTNHFELSCAMHPSDDFVIFAFGGRSTTWIERANINATFSSVVAAFPDVGIYGSKAIVYNDLIYIFGGESNIKSYGAQDADSRLSDKMWIFYPDTNTLELSQDRMNYGVSDFGGIMAEDAIYCFGGYRSSLVNNWMKYALAPNKNLTAPIYIDEEGNKENMLALMVVLSVGCVMFICSLFAFYYVASVRRRKLIESEGDEYKIEATQAMDDIVLTRMMDSNEVQSVEPKIDDSSSGKDEDSMYVLSDDDAFVIETNDKAADDDSANNEESLYLDEDEQVDDKFVDTMHKGTVDTQVANDGEEGFDEYRRIGEILEAIAGDESDDYLKNFKQQKITDKRLFDEKFHAVYNRDHELWKELIVEVGVRFEFFEKIFGDV